MIKMYSIRFRLHIKSSHASTTNLSSSVNIIQSAASRLSPFEEGILNRQLPTTVALSNPPNDAVASSTNTITTSEPSVSQSSATIAPADSKTQENSGQEIILITNEEIEEERPLSEPHRQSATKEPVQQSETEAPAVSTNESSVPSAPSPPHPCPPSSSSSFPQQTQQEDFQALPTASASASTTPTSQLASASISSSPTRMLSQTPRFDN